MVWGCGKVNAKKNFEEVENAILNIEHNLLVMFEVGGSIIHALRTIKKGLNQQRGDNKE